MTIFLLKLTLCWGFFALLYVLLLRQETFFRANRAYLLGTALLGFLLAVLPAEQLPVPTDAAGSPVLELPAVTVGLQQVETVAHTWESIHVLWLLYGLGFGLALARMFWGFFCIVRMAVRGRSERLPDGCLLIETAEARVPFSFFKWVFVPSPIVLEESVPTPEAFMLAHERAHAHGWHSADVLAAELLCVIFWFHPLAHWYRRSLRVVHEYLADAEASRLSDKKQYGLLLIGQSQSGMPIAFANHFFQSPLKQRLIMLTKKASAPVRAAKFGLVVPLALLFALSFRQAPVIAQAVDQKHLDFVHQLEKSGWVSVDTVITFNPETYEETVQLVKNNLAPETDEDGKLQYHYAEIQPQFPGGQEALVKYLVDNLKYPEAAAKAGAEGIVVVTFVVSEDGSAEKVRAQNWSNNQREDLLSEAERVVRSMPHWIPAQHKGKKVRCSMRLPIKFSLEGRASKSADAQPEFPGGLEGLVKYLTEHVKYPEAAKAANAEGTVFVEFVVKEDGTLKDIVQIPGSKPVHPDLVTEALRVVNAMPAWKPGLKDGKVVKTRYTLPVKFTLDK